MKVALVIAVALVLAGFGCVGTNGHFRIQCPFGSVEAGSEKVGQP
jgi:hypothetical protein